MHSKLKKTSMKSKSVFRMTPYLVTVGLAVPVAAQATESPVAETDAVEVAAVQEQAAPQTTDDILESEIPAPTIDTDGDGNMDAWDRNADEKPDAWDTDGDDRPDLLDDDGDGKPD